MKRPSYRSLLVLTLGVACGGDGPQEADTSSYTPPATAHWMADVFADRPDAQVGRILLPGAFNSTSYACDAANGISPDAPEIVLALWGAEDTPDDDPNRQRVVDWAKTQGRPLGQQLEDGIRFVELNVTLKDGVVTTWHSVYGVPLDDVLDEVVAFALAWPDEVVVLTFGLTLDSTDWPLLADSLTAPRGDGASLCDLVYDGPEDAALASLSDVRASGRNLIWAPDGELRTWLDTRGDCPLSHGTTDRIWSITVTPEGVESAIDASVGTRDPQHLLVNDFVFSLDGSATVLEQAGYISTYAGVREASQALGFLGDFPGRLIEGHDAEGNMNVLAGAYYEDTNLVEAAIAENGAR
ncbi:MAG: hypothetical protein Q8P18_30635 [Pseudomonadota bacterium]|nr:hypothetical protein [Pseudomonadota bacterium]